jgi:hypothetical protein
MTTLVPDIGIVVFAFDEGHLLNRTFFAIEGSVKVLEQDGVTSSLLVVLRGSDAATANWLSEKCDYQVLHEAGMSLGEARNLAVAKARGRHLAFIDGCDMWSANFPAAALAAVLESRRRIVCRPAVSIGFPDDYHDPARYSRRYIPDAGMLRPASLLLDNPYPSLFLTEREVLEAVPFPVEDAQKGWTEIDWWWCANLAGAGIDQVAVPDTIHYFRQKNGPLPERGRIGPTLLERPRKRAVQRA